jgi:hypothetical protein
LLRQERPRNDSYYETRHEVLSQGDIFKDVPLAYPFPPGQIVEDAGAPAGARQFLSGPFEIGFAMLITPTCSMRAQQIAAGTPYAHPVRVLAVVRPVDELINRGLFTNDRLGLLRKYDGLMNYMYLPESAPVGLSESVALLYMTVILHHDMIADQRVTQLAYEGAQQLQRKLVLFASGLPVDRNEFKPPMD